MFIAKLVPQLACWSALVLVLARGVGARRSAVTPFGSAGFTSGMALALLLIQSFPGDFSLGLIRNVVAGFFLCFWAVAVVTIYRSGRDFSLPWLERFLAGPVLPAAGALFSGLVLGAICATRIPSGEGVLLRLLTVAVAALLLALAASALERRLPSSLTVSPSGLAALIVALLMLSCSFIVRLDLFAPLAMKVMKFCHDFVHQFFESMLIPDHFFFSSFGWDFIGFFFGKAVGFWAGGVLWFTPVLLVFLAIRLERLPKVSHIRQGAQRRKLISAALRSRRLRLAAPLVALLLLGLAVYQSFNPSVEYWDPKPVQVSAAPSGEIFIPAKGEIDLQDGKLHKYLYRQGGREARFFVLMTPAGKLTVDLDACAICKPDGYGQAEGSVVCYYCKTLIPLETVGKPGGCNPVPVQFTEKEDGVHIDGVTLLNRWGDTVQVTSGKKEGDK